MLQSVGHAKSKNMCILAVFLDLTEISLRKQVVAVCFFYANCGNQARRVLKNLVALENEIKATCMTRYIPLMLNVFSVI